MAGRLEKEIEKILEQSGQVPASGKPQKQGKGPSRDDRSRSSRFQSLLRPGRLFLTSVALFLSALILNSVGVGLVSVFFWLGLVLFIIAYALFFVQAEKAPERRWRGQLVDYGSGGSSWWHRVRRWL